MSYSREAQFSLVGFDVHKKMTHFALCICRAQKQIAELEAEIEALEEELEKATAANKEATETRAAVDELSAEVVTLKERVCARTLALPCCVFCS